MVRHTSPVHKILKEWANALNEGQLERIVELYSDKPTLLPTFASGSITTGTGVRGYFSHIMSREGARVDIAIGAILIQAISSSIAVVSGDYAFTWKVAGSLETFPARFTFVLDTSAERPILHHHSSIPSSLL